MGTQPHSPRPVPGASIFTLEEVGEMIRNRALEGINEPQDVKDITGRYEAALDRRRPLGDRLRNFIAGQTKLSRGLGSIIDFGTVFIPYGGKINNARDAISVIVGRQTKTKRGTLMPILEDKPWWQSKTMWSVAIIVITAILQSFGVEDSALAQSIFNLVYGLAGGLGLYGLRDAIGKKLDK